MQTILGSGGAIGRELAQALTRYTTDIRLVSRHPAAVNPGDQLHPADLSRPGEVFRAVEGSDTVYVTVGFPYDLKVWEQTWPPLMRQVIQACEECEARLVFFDNVYMYDSSRLNPMTEETPWNPPSAKGRVRAQIARMLLDAVESGRVQALIARSADFYGPGIDKTSILTETVFKNLAAGKAAQWLGSAQFRHSFTYTPDAGRATALLGNTPDAYGQCWHLPTAPNPPTGREWVEALAAEMGVKARLQVAPAWMVRALGWFMPIMKELHEMLYQNDRHYVFDSGKFERRFGIQATPYREGIRRIVQADYPQFVRSGSA